MSLLVPVVAVALAAVAIQAGTANAAVSATLNAAVVDGTAFTWTCDVNPDGATIYVAGRSWYDPTRPGTGVVDTARQPISGSVTQRLTFRRDGDPQTRYGYRCVWFSSATTNTLLGRTANSLIVTTDGNSATMFGSNVDGSTRVPCVVGTRGCDTTGMRNETFAEAFARQDAAYSPQIVRNFWSGLPSASCSHEKNAIARPTVQSFKGDPGQLSAGAYNATLHAWLSCFDRPTRVTFYHEPEDNFTTAAQKTAYRAALTAFVTLVEAHPNRANLVPVLILGDWSVDPRSGRNWKDWYTPRVSEIWWDVYQFDEEDTNPDDQTMAEHQVRRPSLAVTRAEGKRYGIGELGHDTASTRPAFLRDVTTWARANNIVAVTYFDSIGALGDHRMRDAASQAAWREARVG